MESGELTGTGLAHVGELPRVIAKGPRDSRTSQATS
jgi:hypothetical protein